MREIKFRAWCSTHEENEMIYDYCFLNKDDNHFWAEDLTNDRPDVDETLDVMQYTGVKDKNGKEIYEGDLFRWEDRIFPVKYFEKIGAFGFAFIADDGVEDFYNLSISDLSEVIGNIHENPELLEKLK
jgi:uncharacterized phage protein (TIGR01671 family)